MKYQIFTDGGARGNPGPAGIGIQVKVRADGADKIIYEQASAIGEATNNEAEYKAFLAALEWLRDHCQMKLQKQNLLPIEKAEFYLDSKLVVEQIKKNWKLKSPALKILAEEAWILIEELEEMELALEFKHVRRENNQGADELVNRALDAQ